MFARILKAIVALVLDFIETAVIALSIFVVVYVFLFQPHQVRGNSMQPAYEDGQYLLTNKFIYRFWQPQRGDVIVFKAPQNAGYDYIKRIIALPGETIKVEDNHVIIDNQALVEDSYITDSTGQGFFLETNKTYTVKEDEYFVMGDNRMHSSDSRDWGPVPKENIIGKAWFRYWPPSSVGLL